MKDHKKAKVISKRTKRGKTRKILRSELTAKCKSKIKTIEQEFANQRSKAKTIPKGTNRKGRMTSWKRGGDFPANRPKAGHSGRTRWTKGNNWNEIKSNQINRDGTIRIENGKNI